MNYSTSGSTTSRCLSCTLDVCPRGNPIGANTSQSSGRTRSHLNALLLNALVGLILVVVPGKAASAVLPEGSDFEVLGPDIEKLSWTPGVAPTATEAELEDVSAPRKGYVYIPGVSPAFDYALEQLDNLHDLTGLRMGTSYSMLFQGLTGGTGINGEPYPRYGAAGRFDLLSSWTVVGRDSENTGQFVVNGDTRFAIGERTPASLGGNIATLQTTANTFTDRGWALRDLFYEQRVWQGQIRFMLGRADSTEYFASTWMQSAQNSFVNRVFAGPATIAAPGHGPAVGVSYRPNDSDFYISGGAANAYGRTTTTGFKSLDQWTFFSYGEVGWTPTFNTLEGRFSVSGWHIGERTQTDLPEDWGVTAVADQQICSMVEVFGRYGYSEAATLRIHHMAQAGLGWRGLIGSTNDMTGLAFSWQSPRGDSLREEKVVEAFYRAQVTRFMQLSVGAQAIVDPGQSSKDVVGAFWGRVRIFF